jgi:hypothetical protein
MQRKFEALFNMQPWRGLPRRAQRQQKRYTEKAYGMAILT